MKLLYICLIASIMFGCSKITNEEKQISFVHTDGSRIISLDGTEIKLKGVNLGNWLLPEGYMFKMQIANSPRKIDAAIVELIGPTETLKFWDNFLENYITEEDIAWIAASGANHVRLPFDYRMLTDDDFLGRNNHGYIYLDRAIEWCKKYDLYVLLDMHGAPGGQSGDNIDNSYGYPWLMVDEGMKQKTIAIWREIADRYADNNTVVGYNLLNEPIAHYFDADNIKGELEPLYKRITAAIREVDTNHIIFIGGATWETDFSIFGEPFDNNMVYTFHKYWMDPVVEEIQAYLNFRDKYDVPLYMGESGENTDEWVGQFRTLLDDNSINWAFWPYKKMENTKGPMNFNKPEGYDNISKYADSDRSAFESVRTLKTEIEGLERDSVISVLNSMVENSKFENCFPNVGYCEGLGFKINK